MKRTVLTAIIGGILLFIWQFLSWAMIDLHKAAQGYTPNQDAIMAVLNENLQEGGYILPNVPRDASSEEMEKAMKDMEGKPWATIQYHKSHDFSMAMNSIRQLLVNIIVVWLFCWIIGKFNIVSFRNVLLCALGVGLIVFLNAPYTGSIWYDWFDIWAHFADAMVCWGLIGLLAGKLLKPRTAA